MQRSGIFFVVQGYVGFCFVALWLLLLFYFLGVNILVSQNCLGYKSNTAENNFFSLEEQCKSIPCSMDMSATWWIYSVFTIMAKRLHNVNCVNAILY